MTAFLPVQLPHAVGTRILPAVTAADRAGLRYGSTGNAHFLLDAAVNFPNQIPIGIGAYHVGMPFQKCVHFAGRGHTLRLLYQFRSIDSCSLIFSLGIVVKNAGFPHKQSFQLLQSIQRKAFPVPINFIVTEPHIKEEYLLLCEGTPRKAVQLFQFGFQFRAGRILFLIFHRSIPPVLLHCFPHCGKPSRHPYSGSLSFPHCL